MRVWTVVAVIAACVLVSVAAEPNHDRASAAALTSAPAQPAAKQARPPKPEAAVAARGNDSCRWANDNECDEPELGTGACTTGTDRSDCWRLRDGVEDDSCETANDGACGEASIGTGQCAPATDRSDCVGVAHLRNQTDSCATSFNGVCEEPGEGRSGACDARTDRSDCLGRARPMTIYDHFFGNDDRVRIDAQTLPWRFMGRFTNSAGEACSATLISRDVIATAAHCVSSEAGPRASGVFVAENGGARARAVAYLVSPLFDYQRFGSSDDIDGLDWALIRLDQPLGATLGFARVRAFTARERAAPETIELYQAGYSWDTGDTLSANVACRALRIFDDGTFAHACDTTRGDSGSGFLIRSGRRYLLVGVDSNFREAGGGPPKYIAVSAASFAPFVDDFVAGRTGRPVN